MLVVRGKAVLEEAAVKNCCESSSRLFRRSQVRMSQAKSSANFKGKSDEVSTARGCSFLSQGVKLLVLGVGE